MQQLSHLYTESLSQAQKYLLASIIFFIIPISGFSTDIFVPSLPAIQLYFNTAQSLTQFTIVAYMLGLGITQLFAGILSDSYGRRKPFLIAMLFYIVTTLWIPFSHSIHEFIFLRLIQGISVAIFIVPIRSMLVDLFEGRELKKMVSYMALAWSIGPIVAPFIGGYLQHYLGWKYNFYTLSIYSISGFMLILFFMPETSHYRHKLQWNIILKSYREILTHKKYLTGVILNGLLFSLVILFATVMPFLTHKMLHYSSIQFGHLALLTGIAWALGSFINRATLHFTIEKKMNVCFGIMLVISLTLVASTFFQFNIFLFMSLVVLLFLCGGTIMTASFAERLTIFPHASGNANSLAGAFIFLIPSISSSLGTYLKATNPFPLTMAFVVIVLLCLLIKKLGD